MTTSLHFIYYYDRIQVYQVSLPYAGPFSHSLIPNPDIASANLIAIQILRKGGKSGWLLSIRLSYARNVVMNSLSPLKSRSSSQKRDSRMNLVGAKHVVLPEEIRARVEVQAHADAKCLT